MNLPRRLSLIALLPLALGLAACQPQQGKALEASAASFDQSSICVYSSDEEARKCANGQLSYFRPKSWGSDQFPLDAAVSYCDFRHQIVHTKGGVVCIFTDQRLAKPAAEPATK